MPTVPVSNRRQVASQSLPVVRQDPGTTAAGGLVQAGRALQDSAHIIEQVQAEADGKAVQEAETALKSAENRILFDPDNGAFTRRGKNAFDLPGQVVPAYEQEARQLESTLKSNRAKTAFREIASQRAGLVVRDLNRHESAERDHFYDEQDEASLSASQQSAANFAGDDERIQREIIGQRFTVEDLARRKGWSPEQTEKQRRAIESGTHSAVIGRLISTQKFDRASSYLAANSTNMLDPEVEVLQRRMLIEEERELNRRDREDRRGYDEASKDGDRLYARGELTSQWVEDNRRRLSADDYRYFYGKLSGAGDGGPRDPMRYADLRERAGAGQDVRDEAREALRRGQIQASDYDRVIGEVEQQRPSWYKRGSSFISTSAGVSDLNPDPAGAQRKASMLDDWAEWAENHREATADEAERESKRIVREYAIVDTTNFTLVKRAPTYLVGSRNAPDIDSTERRTAQAFARGEIDRAEFERQALLLKEWRQAIERTQEKQNAGSGK